MKPARVRKASGFLHPTSESETTLRQEQSRREEPAPSIRLSDGSFVSTVRKRAETIVSAARTTPLAVRKKCTSASRGMTRFLAKGTPLLLSTLNATLSILVRATDGAWFT